MKYIGKGVDIKDRWNSHKSSFKNNNHNNKYMQRVFNKYGENIFKYYIII